MIKPNIRLSEDEFSKVGLRLCEVAGLEWAYMLVEDTVCRDRCIKKVLRVMNSAEEEIATIRVGGTEGSV